MSDQFGEIGKSFGIIVFGPVPTPFNQSRITHDASSTGSL
jgi:hypothetical protein